MTEKIDGKLPTCTDPHHVVFDEEAARSLQVEEIRKRWPRHWCDACNTISYASYTHYLAGDW